MILRYSSNLSRETPTCSVHHNEDYLGNHSTEANQLDDWAIKPWLLNELDGSRVRQLTRFSTGWITNSSIKRRPWLEEPFSKLSRCLYTKWKSRTLHTRLSDGKSSLFQQTKMPLILVCECAWNPKRNWKFTIKPNQGTKVRHVPVMALKSRRQQLHDLCRDILVRLNFRERLHYWIRMQCERTWVWLHNTARAWGEWYYVWDPPTEPTLLWKTTAILQIVNNW